MVDRASLLSEAADPADGGNLAKLLVFFGIPSDRHAVAEFVARNRDTRTRTAILAQPRTFLHLLDSLEHREDGVLFWQEAVSSVFVYAGTDPASFEALTRKLTGDPHISLVPLSAEIEWTVSNEFPDLAQAMGGMQVTASADANASVLSFGRTPPDTTSLVSSRGGSALLQVEHHGVPVFLSTAARVIDLDAPLAGRNFDVRQHFLPAVPVVMYLKWAFARTCWQPAENRACLVIDDPLLKPRYGFLHFETFLDLMRKHNFATSIAFIPWNWRRSTVKVTRLFRESQGKFSLSIHGCDHTGGEFGSHHSGRLAWKSSQASERMDRHASKTGIRHDRVMVFPQGVFSETAMRVLKRGRFIGVVNTELVSNDVPAPAIRIADAWDTALMCYGSFALYTRRYPSDGIGNFAFDLLLGKPCIVVIHHQDCHHRCRDLVAFIDRLNALPCLLAWCNLEEVVRRGYRQREIIPGRVEIEMFGTELCLNNPSAQRKRFSIHKRESEPSSLTAVTLDGQPLDWKIAADGVSFEVELDGGTTKVIRIAFAPLPAEAFQGENLTYRIKALVRRILSEVRDNYITRKPFSA